MTCFACNLTKLISLRLFSVLIALFGLGTTSLTALPSFACCYDPPDYDDTSDQAQLPTANAPVEESQDSATAQDVPEEAKLLLYSPDSSDQQDPSSAATVAENFPLIRRFMADGLYLRARQMAEKRLETRPFDYQLWGLLETIYSKMGLKNKTSTAAKNAETMNPRRQPPPQPSPPMSQQKRYVAKLLQAIGEYKPFK